MQRSVILARQRRVVYPVDRGHLVVPTLLKKGIDGGTMATHPLVLLVEPDPILRRLIRGELKEQGYIVVDAANELDALDFASIYPGDIDLAVTDLPPDKQNRVFTRSFRRLPSGNHAQVLHMSATPDTAAPAAAGGQTFLRKPFDRHGLLSAISRALPAGSGIHANPEHGDRAVFWGAAHADDGVRPAAP